MLAHPEARTKEDNSLIEKSLPKAERLRRAKTRAYKEALHRYSHELLDDEERLVLLDRIKRLQRVLAS